MMDKLASLVKEFDEIVMKAINGDKDYKLALARHVRKMVIEGKIEELGKIKRYNDEVASGTYIDMAVIELRKELENLTP